MDYQLGPDGKPCRACVSVEDMMKKGRELLSLKEAGQRQNPSSSNGPSVEKSEPVVGTSSAKDCPADKDELGRHTWTLLHSMSVYYPEKPTEADKTAAVSFLNGLGRLYPCDFCAKDLRKDLKQDPPKVASREEFADWMCRLHNKVNEKTGKRQFDCSKVFQRWKDGWSDGSCDY